MSISNEMLISGDAAPHRHMPAPRRLRLVIIFANHVYREVIGRSSEHDLAAMGQGSHSQQFSVPRPRASSIRGKFINDFCARACVRANGHSESAICYALAVISGY
jgi:hypothetical protein